MTTIFKYAGLAAIVALAPVAASAVTVSAGDKILEQGKIAAGNGSLLIEFEAATDFNVNGFLVGGQGFNMGSDLMLASFDGPDGMTYTFTSIVSNDDGLSNGERFIPGFYQFKAGDTMEFDFSGNGNVDQIGVQVNFEANPVPLPAGGLLLLSALGAGVVASRRKKA